MKRPLWIASTSALALCVATGLLLSRLETGPGAATADGSRAAAGHPLNLAQSARAVHRLQTMQSEAGRSETGPPEARGAPDSAVLSRAPGYARVRDARGASAETRTPSATSTGEGAALDPLQPLRGTRLTAAFEAALEAGDLATLQGLLISELTMDGTHFAAEDLPMLFDALAEVDDFGLQNLLLTHLDRVDVPGEEKVGGYLDYLQNAERTPHSEAVFKKLVDLGGDETLHGLSEIVRSTEDGSLRRQAAEALGGLRDPRAVPTLQSALMKAADDPRAARPYAQALAQIGGEDAIGTLVDYASRGGNEAALSAIMGVKDPAAARLLAQALNGRVSEAYEQTALRKLQQLADPGALRDLDRYLGQASDPMARLALSAVARIRDPRAPELLEEYAARGRNPQLAEYAAKAAKSLRKRLEEPPREKTKPWKEPRVKTERPPKPPKPRPSDTKTGGDRRGRGEQRQRERRGRA